MKIVFATNNKHKLEEIREILGSGFDVVSLKDIGCNVDIPETGDTLEENARQKAEYVFSRYGLDCFADDTGLEVEALDDAPGVHSARYAEGTDHDSRANMAKLLREMAGKANRKARFRTVISLIRHDADHPLGREQQFEGVAEGRISTSPYGSEGFGYDPVFVPDGHTESFAQLGEAVKNTISHRARAVKKLVDELTRQPIHPSI